MQNGFVLRPEPPFTGVSGPSGPEIAKKSQKGLLGGRQKSPKKYPKKSKNTNFRTFLGIFRLFRVFFGTFLPAPRNTFFEIFLRFRARRALETPVNGGSGCKMGLSVFQYSFTGKDGSSSGSSSWKTVPAVPVPLSVSGKIGEGPKGTAGRGRDRKCHDNFRHFSDNFQHFYDISDALFM